MTSFTWVDFFREFSNVLLTYKGKGNELITKVESAFSIAQEDDPTINTSLSFRQLAKYDIDPSRVEPITVMGIINRGLTDKKRITLCKAFKEEFNLHSEVPQDFNSIPVLDNRQAWVLSGDTGVWELMEIALDYADNPNEEKRAQFVISYEKVRENRTSMVAVTFGLYWSRPYFYTAIDIRNKWYLRHISPELASLVDTSSPSAENYLAFCEKLKSSYLVSTTEKNNLEFSYNAWVYSQPFIFQCNPKIYDIKAALQNLTKMTYTVQPKYKARIHNGTRVYLWVSGSDGGIIAKAKVTSDVDLYNDPNGDQFYLDSSQSNSNKESVWIQFTDKRTDSIIPRSAIINHPVLKDLGILKMAQGTNFPIGLEEAEAIDDLFRGEYPADPEDKTPSPISDVVDDPAKQQENEEYVFNSKIKTGENRVIYGTPGCGKSYYLKTKILSNYSSDNQIRTTFYPDYANSDFVGQILPKVENGSVSYKFNPGPFTLALEKAVRNPDQPVALIIEELNRGNAASIFGDIFQLLDREIEGDSKGRSVYPVVNVNIQDYLESVLPDKAFNFVMIPSNMSIYATMNTSDQNVFTLDTAFKRRWKFEKLSNKFSNHAYANYYVPGMDDITWKDFVESVNEFIVNSAGILMAEDKQIGVYFVNKNDLMESKDELPDETKIKDFAYKVLEYLWDDVAKYNRKQWFADCNTLDDLLDKYLELSRNNRSQEVFNEIFK